MITDLDTSLPLVYVVPQDIGRVLLNLYDNAFWACAERSLGAVSSVAFAKEGAVDERFKRQGVSSETHPVLETPTVTLSTKILDDKIEIQVRDNVPGIPAKIIDKIFQPLSDRISGAGFTTKPTGQGTGFGLSLSYDIVKSFGGTITVNSFNDPPGGSLLVNTVHNEPGELKVETPSAGVTTRGRSSRDLTLPSASL